MLNGDLHPEEGSIVTEQNINIVSHAAWVALLSVIDNSKGVEHNFLDKTLEQTIPDYL